MGLRAARNGIRELPRFPWRLSSVGAGSGRALTDLRLNLYKTPYLTGYEPVMQPNSCVQCSLPCVAMADGVANAGAAVSCRGARPDSP